MKSAAPIGIFDSGVGGLLVMKQLVKNMPQESCIYFADTRRLPYGDKGRETIIRYSLENSIFLIEKDIKVLVVACNTATAHALDTLQRILRIPVIGTIDPGARCAVEKSVKGRIAVLATKGTIESESYQKAILSYAPATFILPIACPLFVPLVEEHFFSHTATQLIVREYLQPIKEAGIDTILLGCTHYPLLTALIREEVGDEMQIVDSATTCADAVTLMLEAHSLKYEGSTLPVHRYFASDDTKKFQQRGEYFLGLKIEHVDLHAV